jgi:diguanylate cyclase (GGDEF)-like protein
MAHSSPPGEYRTNGVMLLQLENGPSSGMDKALDLSRHASRVVDSTVTVSGAAIATWALEAVLTRDSGSRQLLATLVLAVPVIAVLGYFEVSLGQALPSPNEPYVTFESAVLIFLTATTDLTTCLLTWALGQVVVASFTKVSMPVRLFNFGLLVTSGGAALGVVRLLGGVHGNGALSGGHSVATLAAGAATFIVVMYLVLMTSIAAESGISLRAAISVRHALHAVAALAAVTGIGYLAALMQAYLPLWSLVLLAGPVSAVLITSRALSRSGEHRQRLTALFDATKQIQLRSTYDDIVDVMREQAPRILGTGGAVLRAEPPSDLEFGAQVRNAHGPLWVVGTGVNRIQLRRNADQEALEALTTVVEEALLRTSLSDEMSRMAHHDALTGLPNRTLFLDRAELAIVAAPGSHHDVAVLFIDLDGFKAINDRFGHGAGDQLLVGVASRLTSSVRSIDLAGRLGGDEFAVLVERVTSLDDLVELADRIIDSLGAGFSVRGNDVMVGASIGVALAGPGDDADALIRHADLAMYDAKSLGKNRCSLYRPSGAPGPALFA